jgi:hypothetical protein
MAGLTRTSLSRHGPVGIARGSCVGVFLGAAGWLLGMTTPAVDTADGESVADPTAAAGRAAGFGGASEPPERSRLIPKTRPQAMARTMRRRNQYTRAGSRRRGLVADMGTP